MDVDNHAFAEQVADRGLHVERIATQSVYCIDANSNPLTSFNRAVSTTSGDVTNVRLAKAICSALAGMTEADVSRFDHFHELLAECLKLWEATDGGHELLSSIRRAAARLDEVE